MASMALTPSKFDDVACLDARIANLRIRDGVSLGIETESGVLDVTSTAAALGSEDMIFNCRKLIAFVSSIMTMKPGDVIFTGTPQGVIFGEKAPPEQRRWLKAGDVVVSNIEGLGELRVQLT